MHWDVMSNQEYADFETAMSRERIIESHGIYWKPSRTIFYKPLNPFQVIRPEQARKFNPWLGMKQYPIHADHANSFLNLIVFNDLDSYNPSRLSRNIRRNIRLAEQSGLSVEPLESADQLFRLGYPVYQSHVVRTRYNYQKERLQPRRFRIWTEKLFEFPKVKIMGVFRKDRLLSFEINSLVNDVIMLKSIVNSTEGLKYRAPDWQLHMDREMAKKQGNIRMIFDGYISRAETKDRFKLYRGAYIHCIPAKLEGNPLIPVLMKKLMPANYQFLSGLDSRQADKKCREARLHHEDALW